jgi:hypothetical protein
MDEVLNRAAVAMMMEDCGNFPILAKDRYLKLAEVAFKEFFKRQAEGGSNRILHNPKA